jgi:hypothetical protein
MFDPLRRLKYLPWIPLLQVALITVFIAVAIDALLFQALRVPVVFTILVQILNSPFSIFLILGAAFGVGCLAIIVLERFRHVVINASTLWALVGCLALWVLVRSLLPFPRILTPGFDINPMVCMALGVFIKGKPHWRW